MIKVEHLKKIYGKNTALNDISFTVKEGEIVGLLGPNGAGKSTFMNILSGYISATSGLVEINGKNMLENPKEVKHNIGYLPEQPPVYPDMTVFEYLDFIFDLKKVQIDDKINHINEVAKHVGIDMVNKRRIGNLSKGYQQRVGMAGALIGNPALLILDEPTVGLDPKQVCEVRNIIKSLKKDKTVIISSHILSEISMICDRIIILNKGKMIAEDSPEGLIKDTLQINRLIIESPEEKNIVLEILEGMPEIGSVKQVDNRLYEIQTTESINDELMKKIFFSFAANGAVIFSQKKIGSLEDAFIELTKEN